jgi:hypothetical protein
LCSRRGGITALAQQVGLRDDFDRSTDSIHDWAYVLGAEQFYALDKAALIATCVKDVGLAFLVVGFGLCVAPAYLA